MPGLHGGHSRTRPRRPGVSSGDPYGLPQKGRIPEPSRALHLGHLPPHAWPERAPHEPGASVTILSRVTSQHFICTLVLRPGVACLAVAW